MTSGWGDLVLLEARACLERRMPKWIQAKTRIAVYPAGRHTRDLFLHPDFAKMNVVGILDRNASLHGQSIAGCEVLPPSQLTRIAPEVILISSPPHHEAILRENAQRWQAQGIEVIDLCEGAKPYAALFPLALKQGLDLDDSRPGRFKITKPGSPACSIVMNASIWEHSLEVIKNFEWFFCSAEPDEKTATEWILDFAEPGYKTLRRSRLRLHFPSTPEPDSTNEVYLECAGLTPGDIVLDLGAYAGGSAIFFARAVGPGGKVLALEPDPKNLYSLRKNVKELNIGNVIVEPAAIWDQDGEFAMEAEGFMGSSLMDVAERKRSSVRVPAFTMETLLSRHGIHQIRFIKMDIEGAEVRVIRQAMPLLQRLRPKMVVDPHYKDYKNGILNTPEILDALHQGGFDTRLVHQGDDYDIDHPMIFAWWKTN